MSKELNDILNFQPKGTMTKICGLCKKEYKGYGNNPAPLICKGRACDDCNTTKVIRQRIINNGKYTADEVDDIIEDIQKRYS